MKNTTLFCIVLLVSVLSCPGVFADVNNIQIWAVGADLSQTPVWEFDLGQKPYIYINLPEQDTQEDWISKVFSDWTIGTTLKGEVDQTGGFFRREYWLTLPGTFNWSDTSNIGEWNVVVDYGYYYLPPSEPFSSGTGNASFSIVDPNPNTVPEPLSTILFLVGGAALAGKRFLRKK
ncbi:MAG: hypothetical protein PHX64_00755 [Candidatus Omnitrophica bacterium]|nr:hypothetical protein [Candidatus Omnitrophota bacterium]